MFVANFKPSPRAPIGKYVVLVSYHNRFHTMRCDTGRGALARCRRAARLIPDPVGRVYVVHLRTGRVVFAPKGAKR